MSNNSSGPSLLIVDDDSVLQRLARALSERGFEVETASNFDEALAAATKESPEMAVVDLKMPGRSGLELVRELHELDPQTKIVVLTGYGSIATAVEAVRLGAANYVSKPADVDDLLAAFARGDAPPLAALDLDYAAPSLARAEWEHINRVLADCGGNILRSSATPGDPPQVFAAKLQKYPPRD